MAELVDVFNEATKAVADALTPLVHDSTTLKLLKETENDNEYDEIVVLTDSWIEDFDTFNNQATVEIAINNGTFNAQAIQATHIEMDGVVFVIDSSNSRKPQGFDPTWLFALNSFENSDVFSNTF